MAALSHSQLSKQAQMLAHSRSCWWIQSEEMALVEDLIDGFKHYCWLNQAKSAVAVTDQAELMAELDSDLSGERRILVVRDAETFFTARRVEATLLRLEQHQRDRKRLMLMLSRDAAPERAEEIFSRTTAKVNPPTMEKVGHWLAARAAGKWDYLSEVESPVRPEWGAEIMDHVGWDWGAAVQGMRAVRAFDAERLTIAQIKALVPRQAAQGFADVLMRPGGRTEALRAAGGVLPTEIPKVLGLVRWYLRMFGRMRAMGAEIYTDRQVSEELGMDLWRYRQRFKDHYAAFTEERIRRRLELVAVAQRWISQGVTSGVLEFVVVKW